MSRQNAQKQPIVSYWGKRAGDFAALRQEELRSKKAERWKRELLPFLPRDKRAPILDIGTGSGFFSILLAEEGYENVTGIDLTPQMIERAREMVVGMKNAPSFYVMDAEKLKFPSESFQAIVTRNLTWTLPHMEQAYGEWYRVLKKNGVLLNFDANYGNEEEELPKEELPQNHAHKMISEELNIEYEKIIKSLPATYMSRPARDVEMMKNTGYRRILLDFQLSDRIYQEVDEFYNPVRMFAIQALK